jgi:hypothetical protein
MEDYDKIAKKSSRLFLGAMKSLAGIRSQSNRIILNVVICLLMIGDAGSQEMPGVQTPSNPQVKLFVEMGSDELRQNYPSEFSDLVFDSNQDGLAALLKNAGMRVEEFFRDLANTSSKEQVFLQILDANAIPQASSRQEFYYLISQSGPAWKEDRVDMEGHPASMSNGRGFVLTSGFALFCVFLHFNHQQGSRFRYLGRDGSGNGAYVIAFSQKPEPGDYLVNYIDPSTHIQTHYLLQGFAWLQPDSYQIKRIQTSMIVPAGPLKDQVTRVDYQEFQFEGVPHSLWLPGEATVNLRMGSHLYRNKHQYSDYKLFDVQSNYAITKPRVPSTESSEPVQ